MNLGLLRIHTAIPPVSVNNATAASTVLDRQSIPGDASGILFLLTVGATTANIAALKLQEAEAASDATTLTNPTDVKAFDAMPSSTDDNKTFGLWLPLNRTTKRYLQLVCTAGAAATLVSAIAVIVMPGEHDGGQTGLGLADLTIA